MNYIPILVDYLGWGTTPKLPWFYLIQNYPLMKITYLLIFEEKTRDPTMRGENELGFQFMLDSGNE